MSHAIDITEVCKTFRPARGFGRWLSASPITQEVPALRDVTLRVERGEVFGLLGSNGAGKTTLLKILATLIRPDRGRVRVLGYDAGREEERIRERMGFVYTNERSFYWRLSGLENLRFFGALMNLGGGELKGRIAELSRLLGMETYLQDRYDAYSTGMKQRLSLARGLLGRPEVLFMDEPTRGLDPAASESLLRTIRSLVSRSGTAVLMVTHSLSEAERFCDRVGVLHRGRLVCEGTLEELREAFRPETHYRFYVTAHDPGLLQALQGLEGVTAAAWGGGSGKVRLDVAVREPSRNLSRVLDLFHHREVPILHLEAGESGLAPVFAQATREEAG